MKNRMFITYLWTWPQDIIMWLLWILPFWALWGENLRWEEGSLVFNLKEKSWPSRTWYAKWGGTSIGHAIMYAHHVKPVNGKLHRITVHEQFHVKQFASVMLSSFLMAWIPFAFLASEGAWGKACVCAALCWILGHTFHGISNFITAVVLGGRAYEDSYHEQSAYAVDYKYTMTGKRDT